MSASSRCAWALCAIYLSACGTQVASVPKAPPPALGLAEVRKARGTGPDLATIARPGGELLRLTLFIDVGARDAEPPQLASVAVWLAAEVAGAEVQGFAWPDATELTLPCRRDQLATCLQRLAHGLSLRTPEAAALQGALDKLVDVRRRALASDPAREADRLALRALYGERSAGFFPLGAAADDAAITSESVRAYLATHFGPARALLVAAGELNDPALDAAAERAFAKLPKATSQRATLAPAPLADSSVHVAVADDAAFSIALAATTLAQAHDAISALRVQLEREGLITDAHGHAFPTRGGALGLMRVQARDSRMAVRAAGQEFMRLRAEGIKSAPAQPSGDDLLALSRRLGTRWATRAGEAVGVLGMGLGVLIAGGRADRVAQSDPDAALRERTQQELDAALREGRALASPTPHGELDHQRASVVLDNGARLEVRQRAGEQVAIALRFAPGALADPPLLHGRAALLASLATTACSDLAPAELSAQLSALGATLDAEVDAHSWGMLLTAPGARWQEALALALQCALHPALHRGHLNAARLRLLQRLGGKQGHGALLAAAALELSPVAPGSLAPWGSPARQASVSLASLREFWQASRYGNALRVAIVGPVSVRQAVDLAARRLSGLPTKSATQEAKAQALLSAPAAPERAERATLGLAMVRVSMLDADPAGAVAYAALLRAGLAQLPGVHAIWHAGGLFGELGWAAVALSGAPETLASASALLPNISASLPASSLERAADQAFAQAARAEGSALVRPSAEARALTTSAAEPPRSARSQASARVLALRLAQTPPIWLPLR